MPHSSISPIASEKSSVTAEQGLSALETRVKQDLEWHARPEFHALVDQVKTWGDAACRLRFYQPQEA